MFFEGVDAAVVIDGVEPFYNYNNEKRIEVREFSLNEYFCGLYDLEILIDTRTMKFNVEDVLKNNFFLKKLILEITIDHLPGKFNKKVHTRKISGVVVKSNLEYALFEDKDAKKETKNKDDSYLRDRVELLRLKVKPLLALMDRESDYAVYFYKAKEKGKNAQSSEVGLKLDFNYNANDSTKKTLEVSERESQYTDICLNLLKLYGINTNDKNNIKVKSINSDDYTLKKKKFEDIFSKKSQGKDSKYKTQYGESYFSFFTRILQENNYYYFMYYDLEGEEYLRIGQIDNEKHLQVDEEDVFYPADVFTAPDRFKQIYPPSITAGFNENKGNAPFSLPSLDAVTLKTQLHKLVYPGKKINVENLFGKKKQEALLVVTSCSLFKRDKNSSGLLSHEITCHPLKNGISEIAKIDKPRVFGTQSAVVVPQSGDEKNDKEESSAQENGYASIKLFWGEEKANQYPTFDAAINVPVGQLLAGMNAKNGYCGTWFMPRVGQRVIIQFENGDTDFPVITGVVYDHENKNTSPYLGKEEGPTQTQFSIKTCSTPLVDEENDKKKKIDKSGHELTFEDKSKAQKVTLSSSRDFLLDVSNKTDFVFGTDFSTQIEEGNILTKIIKEGNILTEVKKGDQQLLIEEGKISILNKKGDYVVQIQEGNYNITLDKGKLTITSKSGGIEINSHSDIEINSEKDVKIKAANIKFEAKNEFVTDAQGIKFNSKNSVAIKGTNVVDVAGASVSLKADAKTEVSGAVIQMESNGPLEIKGAIVGIN